MSEVQQEVEQITRRSFLRRGLYGLAVVLAGSTGLALQPSRERGTPAAGLKVFSAREYAILCAVADRVMPAAPGLLSGSEMGVAEKLDGLMAVASEPARKGFSLLLAVFENGLTGLIFGERVRPFTKLSPEAQDEVLRGWRDSRVDFRRAGYRALVSICSGLYYADPRSWPAIGYPGPPSALALRAGYADNLVDFDSLRAPGGRG